MIQILIIKKELEEKDQYHIYEDLNDPNSNYKEIKAISMKNSLSRLIQITEKTYQNLVQLQKSR